MAHRDVVIANQIFLGVPWRRVKKWYEECLPGLHGRYPVYFKIVGTGNVQDADDLLTVIKDKLSASSYAVFDATGGNANVSLEFGYAEALGTPRALYLNVHRANRSLSDAPIISDLAGKRHNQYRQRKGLASLLGKLAKSHPFTHRFEKAFSRGYKGKPADLRRHKTLGRKLIRCLDDRWHVHRADIEDALQRQQYSKKDILSVFERLQRFHLVAAGRSRRSRVMIDNANVDKRARR